MPRLVPLLFLISCAACGSSENGASTIDAGSPEADGGCTPLVCSQFVQCDLAPLIAQRCRAGLRTMACANGWVIIATNGVDTGSVGYYFQGKLVAQIGFNANFGGSTSCQGPADFKTPKCDEPQKDLCADAAAPYAGD